jgi:hypothetical protein
MTSPGAELLLESLATARWHVAAQTFGNSHATLIGIVVDWWVSTGQADRYALEGGPSAHPLRHGMRGTRVCDALLCGVDGAEGVVEVEGGRKAWTVEKVGWFFEATYPELAKLTFALLLFYSLGPRGAAGRKFVPSPVDDKVVRAVVRASAEHPEKTLLVVGVDKLYEPIVTGIRSRSAYYQARLSLGGSVTGAGWLSRAADAASEVRVVR